MTDEAVFRLAFVAIFAATLGASGWYRSRAREAVGAIPRGAEDRRLIAARVLVAGPLALGLLAWMVHPPWMAWARLPLGDGPRWAGIALGACGLPLEVWVLRSLGTNISETVLTRDGQTLVTRGPYRWVRHPLYTTGIWQLTALGLVAANGFLLGMVGVAAAGLPVLVAREEVELERRFGDAYRAYRERTGRFLPALGRR